MKKYISLILIVCLAVCCKKEATPKPSSDNGNPFARTDNPSNPADHAIYQLYQSTGLPVFYSDTIATDPLLLFTFNLTLDPAAYLQIKYLQNSADIVTGVNLLRDSILPYLGDSLKPFAVMLVDSIFATPAGSHTILSQITYPGLNGLIIGNVAHIKDMPADTLSAYKAAIFKSMLFTPVANNAAINDFYQVSINYYGKSVYGDGTIPGYLAYKPKYEYGFITAMYESSTYYMAPAQADDLDAYLNAVLTTSSTAFAAQYGAYPLVMQKYNLLVNIVKAAGFKMK